MKICPKCNEKFDSGKFCKFCGSALQDELQEIHCTSCGAILKDDAKFCPECGAKVDVSGIPETIAAEETTVEEENDENVSLAPGEEEYNEAWDLMYSDDADEADFPRAFELFKESAEKGYGESYYFLAVCYDDGKGCEGNAGYAVYWYKKAIEYDDDPYAAADLGAKYLFGEGITEDKNKAYQLFKKSAAKNIARGQFWLGWCSINGAGCEVNEKRAYQNFHLAVKNDFGSSAKNWLARCYENGWGCEENSKKAFELYKQSAEDGDAFGRFQVGLCFLYGFGCDKDVDYGIQLIQEAAENGSEDAQKWIDKANSDDSGEGMSEDNKRVFGKAGAGAAAGAAIGSIVPGVGTVLGATIGGLAGLFKGVIDEEKR
ncbi:MAG TPA: hypothetical protein DCF70_01620 [Treponema sp.]|nr:hypothetical protein [Treponema sp.]